MKYQLGQRARDVLSSKARIGKQFLLVAGMFGVAITASSFNFAANRASAIVPGVNTGVSLNAGGGTPNSVAYGASVSQDGRFIAFTSPATDLVSVTSTRQQVYVRDRLNNSTQMVSISTTGTQGNAPSGQPSISADGRYVSFYSSASNLTSGGAANQIFVRDLKNSTTQVASSNSSGTAANSGTDGESGISADGRYISFVSSSTNLVAATITRENIFLKDMQTGAVKHLSASSAGAEGNAPSFEVTTSCEGRFTAYVSFANNLNATITNNPSRTTQNVFLYDNVEGTLRNLTDSTPQGTAVGYPRISCNGSYISFTSDANNLVSGDTNGQFDAFVYDRINGSYDRVTVSSGGAEANDYSQEVSTSNDGRYVIFASSATNLVSGDTNAKDDVFLRDRQAGTTQLITRSSGGVIGNGSSYNAVISADGRYAIYGSGATNLVSGYSNINGILYSSQTGVTNDY